MRTLLPIAATLALATSAFAQSGYDLSWRTVDCGGALNLSGGAFSLDSTTGQSDAGVMTGDGFELSSGFWGGIVPANACYPNCDGSTISPILNVNDFICFQTAFAAGDAYANCDGSSIPPVLNVNDFICFQAAFAAGCQ